MSNEKRLGAENKELYACLEEAIEANKNLVRLTEHARELKRCWKRHTLNLNSKFIELFKENERLKDELKQWKK